MMKIVYNLLVVKKENGFIFFCYLGETVFLINFGATERIKICSNEVH